MPKGLAYHCLVSLDGKAGTFFLTGGQTDRAYSNKAYILKEGNWIKKEDMPTARTRKKPNLEMQH